MIVNFSAFGKSECINLITSIHHDASKRRHSQTCAGLQPQCKLDASRQPHHTRKLVASRSLPDSNTAKRRQHNDDSSPTTPANNLTHHWARIKPKTPPSSQPWRKSASTKAAKRPLPTPKNHAPTTPARQSSTRAKRASYPIPHQDSTDVPRLEVLQAPRPHL